MILRGVGQRDDSAVTGTAAWISSICAILDKDSFNGPILNDPYARHFAEAISPDAPQLLAALDHPDAREEFIRVHEHELPSSFTMPCYRKPELERLAREALKATGAGQMVIMGAGCDTLSCRLARSGITPTTYEIDRPAVVEFRARVLKTVPLDLSHLREVGVDFDHQTFEGELLAAGYDPGARTVFFAEGLLGYLQPAAVDEIFAFIKRRSGERSRFVFSFTEKRSRSNQTRVANSEVLDQQGEPPVFDLPLAEAAAFVEKRGLELKTLWSAAEVLAQYRHQYGRRIVILPYLHFAVAET